MTLSWRGLVSTPESPATGLLHGAGQAYEERSSRDGVGPMQVDFTPQPLIYLFFLHCVTVLGLFAISSTVPGGRGVIMTAI